ncbi:hypothetical protein [Chitinophaga dinghuensis]|nr:hypothetical protein [Chitinophaga dinghuensis]
MKEIMKGIKNEHDNKANEFIPLLGQVTDKIFDIAVQEKLASE